MTNISVIESKISSIQKYLKILESYKSYSQKQLENDLHLKGSVERYLYLLAQFLLKIFVVHKHIASRLIFYRRKI